ncbi:MAG: exodeoxyribonuclease VII large subunit [bacterium]
MCAKRRTTPNFNFEENDFETVSGITTRIKAIVDRGFTDVSVQGELSSCNYHSSGHFYGALKDENSRLGLSIWRSSLARVPFDLEDGQQVIVHGKIEIYAKTGSYSLIADRVEPVGQGSLDLAFRQICDRLRAQGLFDEERKRPLPPFPRKVAVITSASGAALRDFWRVACDRWPLANLLVIDSLVQGDQAAGMLTKAVRLAGRLEEVDLIVVTRGGGSREDLWPFNDEHLATAIAASPVPVVSAIGHEIDTSVADMVADFRAATPTHAATAIFPHIHEIDQQISKFSLQLNHALDSRQTKAEKRVSEYDRRLTASGSRLVERASANVQQMESKLKNASQRHITRLDTNIQQQSAVLDSLSPLKVLGRGFSVTLSPDGSRVIRSVDQIQSADMIETRLIDGRILSRVESVSETGE